jgi:hypothetical protein
MSERALPVNDSGCSAVCLDTGRSGHVRQLPVQPHSIMQTEPAHSVMHAIALSLELQAVLLTA